MVRAWEQAFKRGLPDALRRNPDFLRPYARALNDRPQINRHLAGEINSSGQAVGCHFANAVDGVNIRLRPNQPNGLPKFYDVPTNTQLKEAAIDMSDGGGSWVEKTQRSTFFPSSWDVDRVLEEMARIQLNPVNAIPNNPRIWEGLASDNVTRIQINFTGADVNNLQFSSVFPK
jgi:hypothetical protein